MDNPSDNFDIYRDSKLRYCGYANEVGESFRPVVPKVFVHSSYAVAVIYVLAECADKSRKIYNVRNVFNFPNRLWFFQNSTKTFRNHKH